MFRRSEERDAEQWEREAARTRAEAVRAQEQARAAWLASPVGAATTAREAGETFFEIQLEVGGHHGSAGFGVADGRRAWTSSASVLAEIERVGWRLEHAGYFFMVTGETSTARLLSGEATAVSGVTIGVYLFRRTPDPDATETTG
jgi:hypothetical protein